MRLVDCHIENFGKLSGYDRTFTEGCNNILASNGQGKSTLATFIRVMFYGFEGESKRGALANERKRFEPWQGGVYGGRLTFKEGERTYTIRRTFGAKSAEDTFELRDTLTNLVSNDYTENIGEELFRVNAESYMRTAYIGQNDVVTHTTDGINAKIGNIAETAGDLESYEKAVSRLTDIINKNSPNRATGAIYKLQDEVTRLRTGVREGSVIVDSIHRLEDSMGVRQEESEKLSKERAELMRKQQKLSEYKDKQALKEQYLMIASDHKVCEDELRVKRSVFPGDIPTEGDLARYTDIATEYNKYCEKAAYSRLTSDEESKLDKLTERFDTGVPDIEETDRLVRRWREHDRSMTEDTGKRAELKILEGELDAEKKAGRTLPTSTILGIAVILMAMIAAVASIFILPSNAFRWVGVSISGIVFVGGTLLTVLGIRKKRADSEDAQERLKQKMEVVEMGLQAGEDKRRAIVEETKEYLDRYKMPLDPASVADDLGRLHTMADEYGRLYEKRSDHVLAQTALDERKGRMDEYLNGLGIPFEEDYVALFNRLKMDLRSYNEALLRESAAKDKKTEFERKNDPAKYMDIRMPEDGLTLEQIHTRLDEIAARLEELSGNIRDESRQHDALAEKLEAWEEDQLNLGKMEQELVDGKHEYKNTKLASKYLTLAKESITAKYMAPLLSGFSKYYGSVTGASADSFHIDANTNITVEELGGQRDTALLSTGYQDLIGFCMRLSLIDAMYEGEKPVLILDDPFVNLDADRLKGAERLMDTLGKDYQMIYFTCR